MANAFALLRLLQLCNSSLPVGAYSYSEGLETLCEQGNITQAEQLEQWLKAELGHGSIRTELAVMMRAYRAWQAQDYDKLSDWNHCSSSSASSQTQPKLTSKLDPVSGALWNWGLTFSNVDAFF